MRQIVKDAIKHQMSKYKDEQTKRDPLNIAMLTCMTMDELERMGFSMNPKSQNGWLYHVSSDNGNLLDIATNEELDALDLRDRDEDEVIEAIEEMLEGRDGEEKLEFVAKLMRAIV